VEDEDRIEAWGSDRASDYGNRVEWQDAVDLLRRVQKDYQGVRRQLELVSHTLAEREAMVNQRLQYAFLTSGDYRTLCLVSSKSGTTASQIGQAILGKITPPRPPPRLMRLEVRCLGRFEVSSDWKRVERWQSGKAKSVFQYLLTKPRDPMIRDVLMEALWAECDVQAAANNLKAAVHGLRRTLSPLFHEKENFAFVLFFQGSYLINPEIELWLDVEEFDKHWMLGRRYEKEEKMSEAIREYELAETLYRGDYLEDEPYEEWTLLRREALKDIYLIILGKLADYFFAAIDYESSIIYCQKILAKDPCREDAYRRLMHCYYHLGQRNRALRWYEICRNTIWTELDTAPDDETVLLYQRLLAGESI